MFSLFFSIFFILCSVILTLLFFFFQKHKLYSTHTKKSTYSGELKNNKRQGKGTLYYKSGEIYEGNFLNNKRHGHGKYSWKAGLSYEGLWENGERSGWGVLKSNGQGLIYEGFWAKGEFNGQGAKYYAHGVYEGHFSNNKENGYGTFVYVNRDKYEGYWLEGQRNGFGTLYNENKGKIFEGTWALDRYEGEGTEYCEKGRYTGLFKAGLKDGNGKFYYEDGTAFEGFWVKGEKCGWGVAWDCSQRKVFEGFWRNGEKNGFGVEFYGTARFEGEFKSGKKCGPGKITWANGIVVAGLWENDVKIENLSMDEYKSTYKH